MAAAPFLFGKLPAHGDFVARGLSDADREAWDAWSTAALAALRHAVGEHFEDAHAAAPPWRFVRREGARWLAGALAPSIDGAGRRYLLALGLDGLSPEQAGGMGLAAAGEAEDLIYEGLSQALPADVLLGRAAERFDDLQATVGDGATALSATPAAAGAWWTLGSETCPPIAFAAAAAPADLFARTVALAPVHAEPEFAR